MVPPQYQIHGPWYMCGTANLCGKLLMSPHINTKKQKNKNKVLLYVQKYMVLLWSETKSSIIIMVYIYICPKDGIIMAPDQNFYCITMVYVQKH